ncbi:MAG TPA: pyridoxamine 5'-phosphate oxidase family protein [Streptosporangiaceae bacterium]|nr:pyridoxamine 5'-phosphate oxidase family protein [Streptosporangiaceae bacterium]
MSHDLAQLQERSFAGGNAAVRSSLAAERRLTGEEIARFLDEHRFATVATTRPDGRPHAAMSSYLRSETTFWLPTMAGTARVRNVAARPWLCMVVAEGEDDEHVAVTLEGPAEVVSLEAAPAGLIDRMRDPSWVRCWLRLTPERLFSYAAPGAALVRRRAAN